MLEIDNMNIDELKELLITSLDDLNEDQLLEILRIIRENE